MKSLIKLKGNKINIFQKQIYSMISLIIFFLQEEKKMFYLLIFFDVYYVHIIY